MLSNSYIGWLAIISHQFLSSAENVSFFYFSPGLLYIGLDPWSGLIVVSDQFPHAHFCVHHLKINASRFKYSGFGALVVRCRHLLFTIANRTHVLTWKKRPWIRTYLGTGASHVLNNVWHSSLLFTFLLIFPFPLSLVDCLFRSLYRMYLPLKSSSIKIFSRSSQRPNRLFQIALPRDSICSSAQPGAENY